MSAAPALEFLQHPDLPQLVIQYLEPRDIHKLCICNSEIWKLMIADLTLLKSYYWNYYGPVLTLFRLEHLPYLLRVGNQKPIRALYMEDLFLVQCMQILVLFYLHNPELFSFDVEALIYELLMVKSFNSPLDWLKIFDDPQISNHIRSQALWTVIMHFQWDNYNRVRGVVGDFRSHTDGLGALVGELELQKLTICDIDQLITECSSLYHMMFILGLGQRLKSRQIVLFYKRVILRAIDCATQRPHSAALTATILFLPRLDVVNIQIRSLGQQQIRTLCLEISNFITGEMYNEEDSDPIVYYKIYSMLFLVNTFTNTAVLQIVQQMISSSLRGGKNLGKIIKFCVELWIFEPHILGRVSLRSRYVWMDQLLTVLVEHFEVIKSQCGQFSTVVFATFLKTWVSEDGCMLMVQTMLKICDKYGFDAAQEEVDNFCEHVYLRLEAGYDIEGKYLDMMQTVEAHVIPLLQERNFDEEDQTYILRRFLVNSDHYGGIVSETDSDTDGENGNDFQEK
ncbi:hypothetical protein MIR68_012235 [Amoeboaphelidium protococcarum]|nr:hypothetical protein MIR68_012235 [Amoeboaphelidium protococcarum]